MLWKIYFLAFLILLSPGYIVQSYGRQWEVIDALFFILTTVGLFGCINGKKILGRHFWQVFVPLFVAWNIAYHYFIPLTEQHAYFIARLGLSEKNFDLIRVFTLLPALSALWSYAYERKSWWVS